MIPWQRRNVIALLRGVALFALSLVGFAVFVGTLLTRFVAVMHPTVWARRFTDGCRLVVGRWTGREIASPYRPGPPPPAREASSWGRYQGYLEWINEDPATGRDDTWLFWTPFVAVAPAVLAGAGVVVPFVLPWAVPVRVLVCVVAVLVALLAAPVALGGYGRWSAALLRAQTVPRESTTWVALVRCASLCGLSMLAFVVCVTQVGAILLSFGLGMVFAFAPAIEHTRWLPNLRRRVVSAWSTADVAEPYRPRPGPLTPGSDGRFYDDFGIGYRNQTVPQWSRRYNWLFKDPATWRDLLWLLLDPLVTGVLTGVPLLLAVYGAHGLVFRALWTVLGGGEPTRWYGAVAGQRWAAVPVGLGLAVLGFALARPAVRAANAWSAALLRPTANAAMALRIQRLTETRTDATEVQAAELRRIERDLHDGAQARLVSVGLTLGAVEALIDKDPAAAKAMAAQARETAAKALADLRDLVRGIHPPVLAERGLGDAVRALALDSPVPVEVHVDLAGRATPAVEAAAYFAVAETMTNAVRHGNASRIDVRLRHADDVLHMEVRDDGAGGADPDAGTGLSGVRRRLGTFDGTLAVDSPKGGPTTVSMELPCALSSPRTSPSSGKA
jgi:signal transduction histidine kinase